MEGCRGVMVGLLQTVKVYEWTGDWVLGLLLDRAGYKERFLSVHT